MLAGKKWLDAKIYGQCAVLSKHDTCKLTSRVKHKLIKQLKQAHHQFRADNEIADNINKQKKLTGRMQLGPYKEKNRTCKRQI